ncbi:MAG: porin family protein [Flavobacteriaceae bacterium]|jgi:hypothetical protein|nr:porin family protein [Flavobacteriaceae bacterium]
MNLRFLLFILIISFYSKTPLYGQFDKIENLKEDDSKKMRFGYYLGLNAVGAKVNYLPTNNGTPFRISVKPKPSFDVGLLADYRINEFLNIRFHPGVAFVEREIKFPFSEKDPRFTEALIKRVVKSNYVRLPVGIKLNTRRIRNARPFVMGSVSYNMNITSEETNSEDNSSGTFRMKRDVYAWEFAIGTDVYLPYFKFTTSVHGFFALSNEIIPDVDLNSVYTRYISSMKSRGIFLRFTFE